jgi:hypothetical protein
MAAGASRLVWHLGTFAVALVALPATFAITRRLGGSTRAAWLATGLCAVTPLYVAQLGTLQTDATATALTAVAWALLLADRRLGFAIAAALAVLTKESAYFVWIPAVWLVSRREGRWRARALLPIVLPFVVAVAWQIAHHLLVGHVWSKNYEQNFRIDNIPAALYHNFVEGGRLLLWLGAALAWRRGQEMNAGLDRDGLRATAAAALLLPVVFPFGLPRYMLLSLPLLAPLCALGLEGLAVAPGWRRAAAGAIAIWLVIDWRLPFWDSQAGHHRDANLRYRQLLGLQAEAAREIAALRPQAVIAPFPMANVLAAPPEFGFLPAPVPVHWHRPHEPLATLCQADLLVHDEQGMRMRREVRALGAAGALLPWRNFGAGRDRIDVYRVSCPAAAAQRSSSDPSPTQR